MNRFRLIPDFHHGEFYTEKARGLTKTIYTISRPTSFGRNLRLAGQIQRAAVWIMFWALHWHTRSNIQG